MIRFLRLPFQWFPSWGREAIIRGLQRILDFNIFWNDILNNVCGSRGGRNVFVSKQLRNRCMRRRPSVRYTRRSTARSVCYAWCSVRAGCSMMDNGWMVCSKNTGDSIGAWEWAEILICLSHILSNYTTKPCLILWNESIILLAYGSWNEAFQDLYLPLRCATLSPRLESRYTNLNAYFII